MGGRRRGTPKEMFLCLWRRPLGHGEHQLNVAPRASGLSWGAPLSSLPPPVMPAWSNPWQGARGAQARRTPGPRPSAWPSALPLGRTVPALFWGTAFVPQQAQLAAPLWLCGFSQAPAGWRAGLLGGRNGPWFCLFFWNHPEPASPGLMVAFPVWAAGGVARVLVCVSGYLCWQPCPAWPTPLSLSCPHLPPGAGQAPPR